MSSEGRPAGTPIALPWSAEKAASETDRRVPSRIRARLAHVADLLIPEAEGMPSAGQVDVAGRQLDTVLATRPDLTPHLLRALGGEEPVDGIPWLAELLERDRAAAEAVTLAIVGGYYMHPVVKERLGYPGQQTQIVTSNVYPQYVSEGLLDSLLERGRLYREA